MFFDDNDENCIIKITLYILEATELKITWRQYLVVAIQFNYMKKE